MDCVRHQISSKNLGFHKRTSASRCLNKPRTLPKSPTSLSNGWAECSWNVFLRQNFEREFCCLALRASVRPTSREGEAAIELPSGIGDTAAFALKSNFRLDRIHHQCSAFRAKASEGHNRRVADRPAHIILVRVEQIPHRSNCQAMWIRRHWLHVPSDSFCKESTPSVPAIPRGRLSTEIESFCECV